ncbi:hypothetical protein [Conexibacter sp. DBS9H8]|nr:hypothetical protein [Conexibacter sp. DBS9H8]
MPDIDEYDDDDLDGAAYRDAEFDDPDDLDEDEDEDADEDADDD